MNKFKNGDRVNSMGVIGTIVGRRSDGDYLIIRDDKDGHSASDYTHVDDNGKEILIPTRNDYWWVMGSLSQLITSVENTNHNHKFLL